MGLQRTIGLWGRRSMTGFAIALLASCSQAPVAEAPAGSSPATSPAAVPASPVAEVNRDVPYVPTPPEVVNRMLEVANVQRDDVLYDLGSGDGRIVITAAQKYGTRGTGIDIDPQRIQESNENAQKAGVANQVRFLQQDLFKTDISDATVVTLYLLPSVNVKLRPTLLNLQPGTRVVSHAFDMGDWRPDQTLTVEVPDRSRTYTVYYWVVPAQVAGTWRGTVKTPQGEKDYTLQLTQQYQKVNGTATIDGQQVSLSNAKLVGDQLTFTAQSPTGGQAMTVTFNGQVEGNTLTGSAKVENGPLAGNYDLVAQRSGSGTGTTAQ